MPPFALPPPQPAGPPEHQPAGEPGSQPTTRDADAAAEQGPGQPEEEPPGKPGPHTGLIVGAVLVGAALLVLGALSVPFLVHHLSSRAAAEFSVGDCVVQDGENPRHADCGDPSAYEIVAQVESRDQCEDSGQPVIQQEGPPVQVFCLAPAAGEPGGEPGDEPADDDPPAGGDDGGEDSGAGSDGE